MIVFCGEPNQKILEEYQQKVNKLYENYYKQQKNWIPLKLERVISTAEIGDSKENFMGAGSDFVRMDNGEFYIIDNQRHCIHWISRNYDSTRIISGMGDGPGELRQPFSCDRSPSNFLFINDGHGINKFDSTGKFLWRYRDPNFNRVFEVLDDNHILTRPDLEFKEKERPYLSVYDSSGRKTGGIGKQILHKNSLLNEIEADIAGDSIFIFYRFLNKLLIYSKDGKLVKEIRPKIELFNQLEEMNLKFDKPARRMSYSSLFSNFRIFGNHIFIFCITQSWIIEIDFNENCIANYYFENKEYNLANLGMEFTMNENCQKLFFYCIDYLDFKGAECINIFSANIK